MIVAASARRAIRFDELALDRQHLGRGEDPDVLGHVVAAEQRPRGVEDPSREVLGELPPHRAVDDHAC